MLDLDAEVLGRVTFQQVIGGDPPAAELGRALEAELGRLAAEAAGMPPGRAAALAGRQAALRRQVNARPGSMAISQEKIRLYTEFSRAYERRLDEARRGGGR